MAMGQVMLSRVDSGSRPVAVAGSTISSSTACVVNG